MKYKTCKTCMRSILVNCEFDCEGKNVTVINVTAKQCPECEKTEIFSLIEDKAKRFALSCDSRVVDYAACEKKESNDAIVAIQMLW